MQAPEIDMGFAASTATATSGKNSAARIEPQLDTPVFAPSVTAPSMVTPETDMHPAVETTPFEAQTGAGPAAGYTRQGNHWSRSPFARGKAPRSYDTISSLVPAPLRGPLNKAWGYVLVALALAGTLALATWTVSDPSLTFAHGGEVENWLGFTGASFADFTMQFLGFTSLVLLLVPLSWGLLKISGRALPRLRHRGAFFVMALVAGSSALGCIAIPSGWPLEVGLGGVVGDAILSIPRAFTGAYPGGISAVLLGLLFVALALWATLHASGLRHGLPPRISSKPSHPNPGGEAALMDAAMAPTSGDEEDDLDGARDWSSLLAAPVGLLLHWGYSLKALWRKQRRQTGQFPQPHPPMQPEPAPEEATGVSAAMARVELQEAHDERSVSPLAQSLHPPHMHPSAQWEMVPQWEEDQPSVPHPNHSTPSVVDTAPPTMDPAQTWDAMNETVEAPHRVEIAEDIFEAPSPADSPAATLAAQQAAAEPKRAVVKRPVAPFNPGGPFDMPGLDLLAEQKAVIDDPSLSNEALQENARLLEGVLEDFGVKGQIIKVRPGPVVTLYELEPAPGVKSSRVIGLAEDIARSMSAIAARVAVVPGRNAIGIELPNKKRQTVYLREQLSSPEFKNSKAKLAMCLGKTIGGEPVIADLAGMPHLLMAGTTGSGKSVGINTMILSLLYRLTPDQCKMIMIDPKMLELSIYDGIPHLLTPVVVDPKKAVVALKWAVREMEERYKKMSKMGVRNIDGFNTRIREAAAKGETITRTVQTGFDRHTGEAIYEHEELDLEAMPFIVVIIDEMADLMMVAGKDIEGTVQRLAQMARAAGIHVIMATQRPSVDVITGTIKANFPTRISFQVTSKIDSRTILGEMGAEQLLGMGDMLFMGKGGRTTRVHGPFVDDQEVEDVVNHLKSQGVPQYLEAVTEEEEEADNATASGGGGSGDNGEGDPYDRAVAIVLKDRKVSTSYIQRRLSIGYNRAASLIERMEQEGVISAANHAGKREILVPAEDDTI
ncbi:MAG: DNA translocase FtsK [Pseudomonadota bacterium]